MAYRSPSVRVESVPNNRIINITEDTRIPAIVGQGPSVLTITDEVVVRSVGSGSANQDNLARYGVSVTQVAAYPGATGSYTPWNNNWSYGAGTSTTDLGYIQWDSGSAGDGQPRTGEVYYVTYTYPVATDQFTPTLFTDSVDIEAKHGPSSSTSGSLTLAAKIALENGAPAVMCTQISGSAASSTVWSTAFDKLKKKDAVAYLVPITTDATVQSAALTHCLIESAPDTGHEREAILGLADGSTVDQIIAKAVALVNKRAIVTPGNDCLRVLADDTTLPLNGSYVAAAVAGLQTAQEKPIQPITGKILVGFSMPDDQFEPYDMNRMGNAGVLVYYSRDGIIKIRHAITTDTASADTEEISIVASDNLVRRITRNRLSAAFIGKGIVIDTGTPTAVAQAVKAIWAQLVRDGLIHSYGMKFDPTTGEVPITAAQDANEPRRINVTGSVKFLYPLNFINVTFFVYV